MATRNILAVLVGLVLGCVGGYLVANAGYGAAITLGFCGIFSPLIVYLMRSYLLKRKKSLPKVSN